MGDLVSREWLLNAYDKAHSGPPGGARKIIENAPDAAWLGDERHTGEWVLTDTGRDDFDTFMAVYNCSECGAMEHVQYDFCPACGSFMHGKDKGRKQYVPIKGISQFLSHIRILPPNMGLDDDDEAPEYDDMAEFWAEFLREHEWEYDE